MSAKRFNSGDNLRMEICENLAYANASADLSILGAPKGTAVPQGNFSQVFFKALLSLPRDMLEETCEKVLDVVEEQKRVALEKDAQKKKIHVEIIVKKVEIYVLKMASGVLTDEALSEIKTIIEGEAEKYGIEINFFGIAELTKFVGVNIQQDERAKADFITSIESLFTKQ